MQGVPVGKEVHRKRREARVGAEVEEGTRGKVAKMVGKGTGGKVAKTVEKGMGGKSAKTGEKGLVERMGKGLVAPAEGAAGAKAKDAAKVENRQGGQRQ